MGVIRRVALAGRRCEHRRMAELVFEITQEADGGYCGECLTLDIFTQADTWDELKVNVREAVRAYFFDGPVPERIRLHLVRDEVLAAQ
jgi:predicted RNase H-like HicB family nuclease